MHKKSLTEVATSSGKQAAVGDSRLQQASKDIIFPFGEEEEKDPAAGIRSEVSPAAALQPILKFFPRFAGPL